MLVFKNKTELLDFLKFITSKLETTLVDSGFEVNLSINPVHIPNVEAMVKTFREYQNSVKGVIYPVSPGLDINT